MNLKTEALFQHRIVRFIFSGGIATLTHIGIAFTMLHFASASAFIANVVGFAVAFSVSYILQSIFVFQRSLSSKNVKRFFVVQFAALLISQVISGALQEDNPYLKVLFVVFLIPLVTYLIHKFWTFSITEE